ncbi:MAG: hypothetical protein PHN56_02810 [Candidatus Nanoarchaeia archaeon]|nr:hypothetical protein [Candidatus Nanoarchaeia archaeon]
MKKLISLLTIMLALSVGFSAVTTKLAITNVVLSDSQIYPSQSGTISFNIQNLETTDLTNLRIIPSSQLMLDQSLITIGTIKSGDSKFIIFTYTAPLTLQSGSYSISIEAKYDSGGQQLTSQSGSTVAVLSSNNLIIENYTTSLLIDSSTNFSITLSNQGNDIFKNVFVNLIMPNGFIPETGSDFYINSLNPGESKTFVSKIFVQKEIEPQSYQFTLQATSNDYSLDSTINLLTIGEPKISINSINADPKIIMKGVQETISCQIENLGSAKAYGIKAELLINDEFKGIKSENLGTLDREDITSAIFEIIIPESQSKLTGDIKITYYDAAGKESTITQSIDYDILSVDGSSTYLIVGAAIVAVVAFFIYKRMKKKK